jgi:hypothetical protein
MLTQESTSGKINLNLLFGVLVCVAVVLGVTAYIVIFGAGTQVVQPQNSGESTSSSATTFVFPSSTASSSLLGANGNASSSSSTTTFENFSSVFSSPYPVTWSEGQSSFAISGATLAGNELTLLVNVTLGDIPQCVPINVRLISDEQGDMIAPTSPTETNFPLSTSTCEGTSNTVYPSEPLTFTVDPTNAPFLFLTGGTSNIYFEVATTTDGGLDVSIPQQSG